MINREHISHFVSTMTFIVSSIFDCKYDIDIQRNIESNKTAFFILILLNTSSAIISL